MTDAEEWWDGLSQIQKNEIWVEWHIRQSRLKIAETLIIEAGNLAQATRRPEALRQSWADGTEAMDCGEASRILNAACEELESKIADFFGENNIYSHDRHKEYRAPKR